MPPFRNHTPQRRNITRVVTKYSDHKSDLQLDFVQRCGYCNSLDTWKVAYYEIDHFIPYKRNKVVFLTTKAVTDYSNLVYSCRSCNNAKRNKWPTNDQAVPNRNNEGFLDPCDNTYLNQFNRNNVGEIVSTTPLGQWMYRALKLHKPQHQIIWQLEELEHIIRNIKAQSDLVNIPERIKDMIISVFLKYDDYRDELRKL